MVSHTVSFRPFSFQLGDSTNSLSRRDREDFISPDASLPPSRLPSNSEGKDTPSVPYKNPRRSQRSIDGPKSPEKFEEEVSEPASQAAGSSNRQPAPSPRSPTFQLSRSPRSSASGTSQTPTLPITKSSQKNLHLTGFDPRSEPAVPMQDQQLSPTQKACPPLPLSLIRSISSNSSGSVYNQAEPIFQYEQAGSTKNSSTSIEQSSFSEGEYLASPIYNDSEHNSKVSNISRPNLKPNLSADKTMQPPPLPPSEVGPQTQNQPENGSLPLPSFPTSVYSTDSNERTTLPEILSQGELRYDEELGKDSSSANKRANPTTPILATSPLRLLSTPTAPNAKRRTKPKDITVTYDNEPSPILTVQDTLEWGIYDPSRISSSIKSKRTTTSASPMFSMESDHLTLPPPLGSPLPEINESVKRRRSFEADAKNLTESSLPLHAGRGATTEGDEERDSVPSLPKPGNVKRSWSNTFKHWSPTRKKHIITNSARRADGPATPMPPKYGVMESMMRGKEVLEKVGKSFIGPSKEEKRREMEQKTREDKKRESLKKKIQVLEFENQDPSDRRPGWV
ncbi:hypothetical protein ONS95_007921 [Cadophora gregata]|uniref:uncharacterized protein n=1 Tax=Cadophora gregata TaxID=51156 RepID=UPI0026DB25BB|nr:uncharacterized protein ONS95_007921 [Cadophora gregata]KAK0126312.1 hypothetical protein ONS95_007921 [Cadophora gregata]